jgi:transcriptional regulator with XRE-family HTH domain
VGTRYVPEQVVRDVGRRIAEVRRERGMTQIVLAARLRYSVQHISQLENGTNITVHTLALIANALEATLEDLVSPPREPLREVRRGRPSSTGMQPVTVASRPRRPRRR